MNEQERILKELNEIVRKDIAEGKNEIIWILKTIMFLAFISIFLVLIFSIFS